MRTWAIKYAILHAQIEHWRVLISKGRKGKCAPLASRRFCCSLREAKTWKSSNLSTYCVRVAVWEDYFFISSVFLFIIKLKSKSSEFVTIYTKFRQTFRRITSKVIIILTISTFFWTSVIDFIKTIFNFIFFLFWKCIPCINKHLKLYSQKIYPLLKNSKAQPA